ncbi:MAG: penicillin-binding protein activator [Gammaproteobacteria bacterium]|nr:penicillin-binding protein activator [Gammaproteobacteria bacterium]
MDNPYSVLPIIRIRSIILLISALLVYGCTTTPVLSPNSNLDNQSENKTQVLLLNASELLNKKMPQEALTLLSSLSSDTTPEHLIPELYQLRAQAYQQTGQRELAAQTLMRSPENSAEERIAIEEQLWPLLAMMSPQRLENLNNSTVEYSETGWFALAQLYHRQNNISIDFEQELSLWQETYPDHPASSKLLKSLLELERSDLFQPRNIALLLPASGPFAKPATAVRNGFAAAFYQAQKEEFNPTLRFYDSGTLAEQTWAAYEKAVEEGADVIIGPLNKEGVNILATQESLPVPTLALNYSTHKTQHPENLFQFGLAPEDEAEQVAEKAWLDGHNQAILITPDSPWGHRIANAFSETWSQLGGITVETTTYAPNTNNFSSPLQAVLNLDESKARIKEIGRFLGRKVHSEPRRRQDIDFVFIAAQPQQARQIRPQLKFFYAADLPVYATSHVYTGSPNPSADRDLNGIRFSDMPWIINIAQPNPLWQTIESATTGNIKPLKRLYALGIDSYELLPHLPRLSKCRYQHFSGKTGFLRIQDNNRIFRGLQWAQFVRGKPKAIKNPSNF